jgi:hypothetical protein
MTIVITLESRGSIIRSHVVDLTFSVAGGSARTPDGTFSLREHALSRLSAEGRCLLATAVVGSWYANL